MGWIFVIEDDETFFKQIEEAVTQLTPKMGIVRFKESRSFLDWMMAMNQDKPNLQPPPPDRQDQFMGLITSIDSWRFREVKLIGKFKTLFVQKGLAQNEESLGVVFTGFDSANFQKKRYENRSVNNFIYKPFDKILLVQMLSIAFSGRQAIKKHFVHNQKIESKVEMLKEISSVGITELGFHTLSNRDLQLGEISKYYADFLLTNQHRSALAQILSVKPNLASELSRVYLRFFALDQQQSFNVQKLVREKSQLVALPTQAPAVFELIFVRHEKSSLVEDIQPSMERFFDHSIHVFNDLLALDEHLKMSAGNAAHCLVFIDGQNVLGDEIEALSALKKSRPEGTLSLFLLSPKIYSETLELELSHSCEDVFYRPFNRSYIIKSIKQRWPALKTKEDLFESQRDVEQVIHASTAVKMVEVSEAGVVIEYYRPITLGTFREFVFWMADEASVPTLLAQCNFCAPAEGKAFHCHFVFFGLHDTELKFIRLWMMHQYVEKKQKAD